MKALLGLGIALLVGCQMARAQADVLQPAGDWLLYQGTYTARLTKDTAHHELTLTNGLLSRRFRISPNVACVGYTNETTGEQLIRAVMPEARLVLSGKTYAVGGLYGQREKAYLEERTINSLVAHRGDFQLNTWKTCPLPPRWHWVSHTWTGNPEQPKGIELVFTYKTSDLEGFEVEVHYALYDGLPLMCKWVTLRNRGSVPVAIGKLVNEILATPEEQSAVVGRTDQMARPHGLYIESNYAFNNAMRYDLSDQTTHWLADSSYTSQVNYNFQTPCLMESYPPIGPGVTLDRGDTLESVRTFELLMDGYDRERRGMAIRRMYRTIAPWTTQNPIFMHLVSRTDADVYAAIDQCKATGYEALILSFGSHCDMEDTSAISIARWTAIAAYARREGVLIGGYSLFSSRHISDSDDVISPRTGKPGDAFFGYAPCYGSRWGLAYLGTIEHFLETTHFDLFENDGPYAGDVCASTAHPGHRGLEDSQWAQMLLQKSLYHWCSEHGIYVNAPDWYFLDGTNKIAIGYREVNFSLPREEQMILNRQNIFDGTWEKTPSMGWGFVPLTRYQGGGPEAVLEPLKDHLRAYAQLMFQYYSAGVQACYRGPRLYDTDSTRALVTRTIAWYKTYRTILNGDIVHLRRPDGRDWDGILHVDPKGGIKGLVLLYNPLPVPLAREISVPLYYTGLSEAPAVRVRQGMDVAGLDADVLRPDGPVALPGLGPPHTYQPDRAGCIHLRVTLPANGYQWYTLTL